MPSPRRFPRDRLSGFALLITITLLAFLVLLLVSLASLTRVETQVASNNQQLTQARQNALLALNIALGRIQALAGPDQRITATAEIVAGAHPDKRKWTGVWNTTTASPAPEWLVSTAAPASALGSTAVTSALPASGTVPLVSNNTVDTGVAGNAVTVETQPVTSDSVPGIPGTQTVGNFAYWVGDEGVKAKVSLTDPWSASSATPAEQSYRLRVAQRSGIELVDASPGNPLTTANYPANDAGLSKVLDLKQLPLASAAGNTALGTAIKNRFHDLTASSYSVLADVAQGGLKKDLTSWLAHPSPATGAPADSDFLTTRDPADATGFSLPRWGLLRSYAGLADAPTPLTPQQQTDTQHGVNPVISYFRMSFGVSCPGDGQPMVAHLFPLLVLWNPYDAPIRADQYEFVFGIRYNENNVAFQSVASGTTKGRLLFSSTARLQTGNDTISPNGSTAGRTATRLRVVSPVIQPGQSLVFTLASSGAYQLPGNPGAIPLTSDPAVPPAVDNSLQFSNPAIVLTPAERAGNMRIIISGGELDMGLYSPQPAAPNPTVAEWRNLTPYHLVQHFGLTSRTGTLPIPADPDDAIPGPHYWHRLPVVTNLNNQFYRNPRWLANLNPRAPLHVSVSAAAGGNGIGQTFLNDSTNAAPNPDVFDGNQVSAGYFTSPVPAQPLVVAELLVSATQREARLLSLAQLQHVNLSKHASAPSYAVGNSQVHYLVGNLAGRTATSAAISPNGSMFAPATQINRLYDLSYLVNQTLWDRYFFSGIPQTLTDGQITQSSFHLPNARHVFYTREGAAPAAAPLTGAESFNTASAGLLLNGGFNVNSTSEQAWRALLSCHNNLDTSSGGTTHPFSRFARTAVGDSANQTRTSGYRILSDAQIALLAANIVAEVRARGPFLSLASFINRRLADDATGYKGPLQSAIDATDAGATAAGRINSLAPFTDAASQVGTQSYYPGSTATTAQQKLHLASDEDPAVARTRPSGSRTAFMPGFLTQADLLNSLGPVLTARSDTFVIRSYGDVQNPATAAIEGRAWCEAVVQRLPDYADPSLPPETDLAAAPASAAKTTNLTFGRRFKTVSFRWLSASDL